MKIFIGADHRGFKLKKQLIRYLKSKKYDVVDVGTHTDEVSCDYPKISEKVAKAVTGTKNGVGILACMTGIGHSIAANKIRGARAALCYNKQAAFLSRSHNNANILVVGSKFVKPKDMAGIVTVWLKTSFEGGRHLRRVNQIKKIEKNCC